MAQSAGPALSGADTDPLCAEDSRRQAKHSQPTSVDSTCDWHERGVFFTPRRPVSTKVRDSYEHS